jgi:hypothetical protein
MKVVSAEDVVVGQYRAKGNLPAYLDDSTVPVGRCVVGRNCRLHMEGF